MTEDKMKPLTFLSYYFKNTIRY